MPNLGRAPILNAATGRRWREAPLAEINYRRELQAWLRERPREVSVAFAARAALRVLPFVWEERGGGVKGDFFASTVLPVFRATGVAWAVVKYPAWAKEFRHSADAAAEAAARSSARFSAASASAAVRSASAAVRSYAAEAAADAAHAADRAAAYAAAALWSAVSVDATRVEEGATASDIARSPLWPQGQPDRLHSLWQEMKAALLAAKQDWQVWTIWYDDRLDGRVRDEERELAFVRIEQALWDQGPAIVNAEIRRLAEEQQPPQPSVVQAQARISSTTSMSAGVSLSVAEPAISAVPVDNPPIAGAAAQHHSEVLAAWQSADAALQTPHPGRQYVPDVFFNPVALVDTPPAPIEAILEQEPLAPRFCVNSEGLIDLVPDSPAPGTAADPTQRELYEEIRLKAQSLVAVGPNQLGDLSGPANRFCDGLKDRIEDISITSLWSRGNTLRIRLNAHDLSTGNDEPDPGRLHSLVAETLRDLVHTWNTFIVGDPKGRELDEIRLGPQELQAAKELISLAAPIIEALRQSNNVATERAKQAAVEQAAVAKDAPAGIIGDQAIDLSQKTTRNFVKELVRRANQLVRTAGGFAQKEIVAGALRKIGADFVDGAGPQFVAFVAEISDALKSYVAHAWPDHALNQIVALIQSWPHKFEQSDKWIFCLTVASMIAANQELS